MAQKEHVIVKCLSLRKHYDGKTHPYFTVGNLYCGKPRLDRIGIIVVNDVDKETLILMENCAIGTWELMQQNTKNTNNKKDIWDAVVAASKR